MRKILIAISLSCLVSCSTQAWYAGAQSAQTTYCMKLPISEYDDCMKQSNTNYDEYEKDRESLSGETRSTP